MSALTNLNEIIKTDIDTIREDARHNDRSLSEELAFRMDDSSNPRIIIEKLLMLNGFDVEDTTLKLNEFYDPKHSHYACPLLYEYLQCVYLSCFDRKFGGLSVYDLCRLIPISGSDYRLVEIELPKPDEMKCDIYEGHVVSTATIKLGKITKVLGKLAYGTKWTHEFARNSPMHLFEIVDFVIEIGNKQHYMVLEEALDLLLGVRCDNFTANTSLIEVEGKSRVGIDVDDFIYINNYLGVDQKFDCILGIDSAILKYNATQKALQDCVDGEVIGNMLPPKQSKFITHHPVLKSKANEKSPLLFLRQAKALKMLNQVGTLWYHPDELEDYQIIRNYFCMLHNFIRNEKETTLLVYV